MKRILSRMLVVAAVLMVSALPASATLVANGGFETSDFTGWTHAGNTGSDSVSSNPTWVHSGIFGAQLGAVSPTFLYQDLVTIPGQTYSISFWLKSDNNGNTPDNFFTAYWGNTGNTLFSGQDLSDSAYTKYTYLQVASSTTTQFGLLYANIPWFFGLDDVDVSPVPIPGAVWLLGSGIVGLIGLKRRMRK